MAPPRTWLLKAGAALVVSGAALAIGPGAPWLVEHVADGQRVWRLGRIQIDGVSGSWLGDLRARRVWLADGAGIWLEAEDLTLRWRPQDLAFGAFRLDEARARAIDVLRQPALSERRRADGALDVHLGAITIDTLSLEAPVVGETADFTAELALDVRDRRLEGIEIGLRRTDSNADRALVLYQAGEALNVDVAGQVGGVLAHALGVPDKAVQARATGDGREAAFSAHIGAEALLTGAVHWRADDWAANADAQLHLLPRLATLSRRIGAEFAIEASGARTGSFTAHAETPFLALDLSGERDERGGLDGAARFVATTQRLSDIARESPFELGRAQLDGELHSAHGAIAIEATLDTREIDALGRRTRFSGPVQAMLTDEAFALSADLRAPEDTPALFARARLRTDLSYDRTRRRFALDRADLEGDAISLTGRGWATRGDGEFAGEWRVRRLDKLVPAAGGSAAGRWRAIDASEARAWIIAVDGQGEHVNDAPGVLAQLLGPSPRLDARLRYEDRGFTVSHARIDGARLRAGVVGRVVRGQADLALEASARGPLSIGGAEIAGAADATGRVTGPIGRPSITAHAALSSVAGGGITIEQPIVDFSLTPQAAGYVGRAEVQGLVSEQTLAATAEVSFHDGALRLTSIDGQWGALQAQGSASFAGEGANAALDINGILDGLGAGVAGRIAGRLDLTPENIAFNASIADGRLGELRVRTASLRALGTRDALDASFDMRGRLGQAPLTFAGDAKLRREGRVMELRIDGDGELARTQIATRSPIHVRWEHGATESSLDVAMADGAVTARWRDGERQLSGSARIENAPLGPLAAIWGERASGRIDGRIDLANAGRGLSGEADLTLTGARFAGRQRGMLDLRVVGDLDPTRLAATIDATSTEGLSARFEADAPVVTSTAPIRIALAPERRGRATWRINGPAASLWAAARLRDQSLEGELDGAGELSFGAGHLSGDGHIEIADGRFEDKLSGVTLIGLDARLGIGAQGVMIERFTASGPHGGRLSATGGGANPHSGEITVRVENVLVADRPDARALASGDLTFAWEGLHSTLSGALALQSADLDIAASPDAGIPTLEVVEVNRPGDEGESAPPTPAHRNGSTALDIAVTAPGRVFTRGRGLNAEWTLDLRLDGTARNPRLFGQARAVRGTLALSGQPFEIEEARITFDGDPLEAQIDMTAARDTADLSASLRLAGTARDPEITFTSDPPLPEDEILPHVLFGRSMQDLSPFEGAQLATSLAALSGRASLDLVDVARAAAGLDRFNVRQDEGGGFLVAGGVYLTRDVYVEVARTGLGQAQTRVEWTVRPRLVMITSFLGDADQRVSLRWRRESD